MVTPYLVETFKRGMTFLYNVYKEVVFLLCVKWKGKTKTIMVKQGVRDVLNQTSCKIFELSSISS